MATFNKSETPVMQSKSDRLFEELHQMEKQIHFKTEALMPKRPPAPKSLLEAISLIGLSSLMD